MGRGEELSDQCEAWIDENIAEFSMPWNGENKQLLARIKFFGEFVLLIANLSRLEKNPSLCNTGKQWLAAQNPSLDAIWRMCSEFPQSVPLGVTLAEELVDLSLIPQSEYRLFMEKLGASRELLLFEHRPSVDVMIRNSLEKAGLRAVPETESSANRMMVSCLSNELEEISFTSAYYYCHDVFYSTNWGRTAPVWTDVASKNIAKGLEALSIRWAREGEIDLVCELVMAAHYGGLDVPTSKSRVFLDSCETQQTLGFVLPSPPSGQGGAWISKRSSERETSFYQNYHTCIVYLIAWSILNRP